MLGRNGSFVGGARALVFTFVGFGLTGCSDSPDEVDDRPQAEWTRVECDPLVPEVCAFPFPSNAFTSTTSATVTGRRLALSLDMLPTNYYGIKASPTHWNRSDGFSTGAAMLAYFPGLEPEHLVAAQVPTPQDIDRSLNLDSPTILMKAETGEWVPHWAQLDMSATDPDQRAFMIRPAQRLEDNERYIVAIRDLPGVTPSSAFLDLRDMRDSNDPTVGPRRELFEDIFGKLKRTGVDRSELQLAWDFNTASRENNTGWMLHMRDQALALVGEAGPTYTIHSVQDTFDPETQADWAEHIAYRIFGEMQVPLYLTTTQPGGLLVFDADGNPTQNPEAPWAMFSWELLIPRAALEEPVALMQYGHGLLGEKEQIESGHFLSFIDEYNYALFGVDFVGMAADDELYIGGVLDSGRFDDFFAFVSRQHQGMLNSLLAMRLMKGGLANDPQFGQFIDGDEAYYHGISQGGIFGGTYMALTTDVQRGVLGVPGMPYNLLLNRSVDFDIFFDIIKAGYPDGRDIQLLLNLAQILWDRTEPNGYASYINGDPLPDTPNHQVLLRAALGDHQVNTLAAHFMARAIGATHVDTGLREIYGLSSSQSPYEGSALVEYDFGLPPDPVDNLPPRECEDPHGKLRKLEEAREQLDTYLRTGRVQNFCADGTCDFSEMSGCMPGGE